MTEHGFAFEGILTPDNLHAAIAELRLQQRSVDEVRVHPIAFRDFYSWDLKLTGWKSLPTSDATEVDPSRVAEFGGLRVLQSPDVPRNTFILVSPDVADE